MSFNIIWNNDGTIINFYENISIDEINKANDMLYKDKRYEKSKYTIINILNAISDNTINKDSVMFPAAMNRGASQYIKKMKNAFVVIDEHDRALCQRYIDTSKDIGSTWEFSIFNSMEEALAWGRS